MPIALISLHNAAMWERPGLVLCPGRFLLASRREFVSHVVRQRSVENRFVIDLQIALQLGYQEVNGDRID